MSDRVTPVATGTSYAASGVATTFGALSANDIAAYCGVALGVLTFAINWYYRHKHFQLARSAARSGDAE